MEQPEMINNPRDDLSSRFHANPPANPGSIDQSAAQLKLSLPPDYVHFLLQANGGEGFIGEKAYLVLWRVEDLSEMNLLYHVAEFTPGLVLFGSDGGDEAFAFDMRSTAPSVVSVPFVGMALSSVQYIAQNFHDFLDQISHS
jgi:hypothetical protein